MNLRVYHIWLASEIITQPIVSSRPKKECNLEVTKEASLSNTPAGHHGEGPGSQPSLAQRCGGVHQGGHDLGLGRLVQVALRDEPRRGSQDPENQFKSDNATISILLSLRLPS